MTRPAAELADGDAGPGALAAGAGAAGDAGPGALAAGVGAAGEERIGTAAGARIPGGKK